MNATTAPRVDTSFHDARFSVLVHECGVSVEILTGPPDVATRAYCTLSWDGALGAFAWLSGFRAAASGDGLVARVRDESGAQVATVFAARESVSAAVAALALAAIDVPACAHTAPADEADDD